MVNFGFRRGPLLVPVKTRSDLVFGRIRNTVMFLVGVALVYPVAWMLLREFTPLSEIRCQIGAIFISLEFFAAGCWAVWTGKFEFSVRQSPTTQGVLET